MRPLLYNTDANFINLVGGAIGIFILIIIGVLVFYNIAADIDPVALDTELESDGATEGGVVQNATNMSITQFNTFSTIAPFIGLVLVAVAILLAIRLL